MSAIHIRVPLAAAAVACLLGSSLSFAQAASGPWAKVPPLSTLCYQWTGPEWNESEPFIGKLETAKAAITADREKQEEINTKIATEHQSMDPMEMASRMQQWMMDNPEEAMKFMQGAQAMGEQMPETLEARGQRELARDAEWKALVKRYEDALIQAYAPAQARLDALRGKTTKRQDLLYPRFMGDPSDSPEVWAAGEAANAAADKAYQSLCPQWWGANGEFHTYLRQQKAWFINERIPELGEFDAPKLQQYAMMNTPAATYRSTAEHTGVIEYLDLVWRVFGKRDGMPRCTVRHTCGGAYR